MTKFKRQDQVKIIEAGKTPEATYTIKAIKKSRDGRPLYLLRSEEDETILRLYYENDTSMLSKVD